jgi:hypothetical protein
MSKQLIVAILVILLILAIGGIILEVRKHSHHAAPPSDNISPEQTNPEASPPGQDRAESVSGGEIEVGPNDQPPLQRP